MIRLYTQRQLDMEIERRMMERDRSEWFDRRFNRIEKRLYKLEQELHGNPSESNDCCVACTPVLDPEDYE